MQWSPSLNLPFLDRILSTVTKRERAQAARLPKGSGAGPQDLLRLADSLLSDRGEASGVALARDFLAAYRDLDGEAKTAFFAGLLSRFGPARDRLDQAIRSFQDDPSDNAAHALHEAAEPRRQELIRRLNLAGGGTAMLVAMREDLLRRLKGDPALGVVDTDFAHLFSSWFNRGFLVVKRIDWTMPAVVLEKIIQYEAVHEINGWRELRSRIDPPDRRCYAFFHPALVDEPLIFVQVALTRGIPDAIGPILDPSRQEASPDQADTAAFYSISNCQAGLQGISFGHFLIKQVVEELARDLPQIRTFVTLSPVPAFMSWLGKSGAEVAASRLTAEDRAALESPKWFADKEVASSLKERLLPLAAHYFLRAKTARGEPVDPVARFHLRNGARLERINWLGDVSPKGLQQAAGLMVNYLYDRADIERNHEAFATSGTIVASPAVSQLLE
ncbi:MAG: malonyl-CoA decarboxylase [Rhodospirillales bacterium]|nr:malonyl-CoA decarboxylase [Rhodospirillales bacterium]